MSNEENGDADAGEHKENEWNETECPHNDAVEFLKRRLLVQNILTQQKERVGWKSCVSFAKKITLIKELMLTIEESCKNYKYVPI